MKMTLEMIGIKAFPEESRPVSFSRGGYDNPRFQPLLETSDAPLYTDAMGKKTVRFVFIPTVLKNPTPTFVTISQPKRLEIRCYGKKISMKQYGADGDTIVSFSPQKRWP